MLIQKLCFITGFFMSTSTAIDMVEEDAEGIGNSTAACSPPIKQHAYNISELCASCDDIPPSLCCPDMLHNLETLQQLQHHYNDNRIKYMRNLIPAYFHNATLIKRSYVETLQCLVTNATQSCVFVWTSILEEEMIRLQRVEREDEVIRVAELWVYYILPPFVCFVVIVALPTNLLVIAIIIGNQEMRTCPNIILLNLSIGDSLFLLVHVVFNYFQIYCEIELSETTCCIYAYFNALTTNLSVYSMVVLSYQRFMATRDTLHSHYSVRPLVLVVCAWILAGLTALLSVTYRRPRQRCFPDVPMILVVCDFIFTCILPMLVICAFYRAASKRLRFSVQSMPGEASGLKKVRRNRERGASILPALSVVFAITYLPLYTLDTVHHLSGFSYTTNEAIMHLYHLVLLLFPFNSFLNPVALFIASKSFRLHYKNYVLCRRRKRRFHSYGTQSGSTSINRTAESTF